MGEDADEADLVRVARRGGAEGRRAFDELVRRHQQWLVRLLTFILGSQAAAEDVAQDAFVRAFERLPRAGRIASFRSWLRTLATRLAFNARRDAATRRRYQKSSPPHPARSSLEDTRDTKAVVIELLDALSYSYREILVLRYVEELELAEIADMLELGPSAAKMRLKRARDEFLARYTETTGNDYAPAE